MEEKHHRPEVEWKKSHCRPEAAWKICFCMERKIRNDKKRRKKIIQRNLLHSGENRRRGWLRRVSEEDDTTYKLGVYFNRKIQIMSSDICLDCRLDLPIKNSWCLFFFVGIVWAKKSEWSEIRFMEYNHN